jgi:hypothetical protein
MILRQFYFVLALGVLVFYSLFLSSCGSGFSVSTHTADQYQGSPAEYCTLPANFPGLPEKELTYSESELTSLRTSAANLAAQNKLQEAIWLYDEDPLETHTADELRDKLRATLSGSTFTVSNNTLGGAFEKYILTFENGIRAIFRPGATPSYEWIAYRLNSVFKFSLVPMVVDREINGRSGSVQYLVADMTPGAVSQVSSGNFRKMLIFDYFLRNRDRDLTNFLFWPLTSRVIAIDHGAAFGLSCGVPSEIKKHLQIESSIDQKIKDLNDASFSVLMSDVPIKIQKMIWKQITSVRN